jgi:hypothetical protein
VIEDKVKPRNQDEETQETQRLDGSWLALQVPKGVQRQRPSTYAGELLDGSANARRD